MLYMVFIGILAIDQLTKYFSVEYLQGQKPIVIIDNFLQLNYVENYGAAFGIMQNKQWFFIIATFIVLVGIIIYMKTNNKLTFSMRLSLVLIASGALGNLIDRIRLGYVIDMIDVNFGNFYDYPVFNVADSAIVIATIFIMYLVIFDKYEKERVEI